MMPNNDNYFYNQNQYYNYGYYGNTDFTTDDPYSYQNFQERSMNEHYWQQNNCYNMPSVSYNQQYYYENSYWHSTQVSKIYTRKIN